MPPKGYEGGVGYDGGVGPKKPLKLTFKQYDNHKIIENHHFLCHLPFSMLVL